MEEELQVKQFSSDVPPHNGLMDVVDMFGNWLEEHQGDEFYVHATSLSVNQCGWDLTVVYESWVGRFVN